jgi:hypothetical protein
MKLAFPLKILKTNQLPYLMKIRPVGVQLFHSDRQTGRSQLSLYTIVRTRLNTSLKSLVEVSARTSLLESWHLARQATERRNLYELHIPATTILGRVCKFPKNDY